MLINDFILEQRLKIIKKKKQIFKKCELKNIKERTKKLNFFKLNENGIVDLNRMKFHSTNIIANE